MPYFQQEKTNPAIKRQAPSFVHDTDEPHGSPRNNRAPQKLTCTNA
jgi:hypothetical protein